jgi:chemotaxis protein CheX
MRMELIQPFINATDAVLAQHLNCTTNIQDVSMDEHPYRRRGIAALIRIQGEIEGRVIFDLEAPAAVQVAAIMAGGEIESNDPMVPESICELANMVIGNAITSLNDQGFQFHVAPPEMHTSDEGLKNTEDQESLVMCFETPRGCVFLNIAMHYHRRRKGEREGLAEA